MNSLPQRTLEQIFHHGEETYPYECCGLVLADGTVRRATNIQNELHSADPARYTRDASRGYTFSPTDLIAMEKSLELECPAQIIYHSHPDVGAYFSDEDRSKALFCGTPIYPVSYLVVDVKCGQAMGASLFSFVNGDLGSPCD